MFAQRKILLDIIYKNIIYIIISLIIIIGVLVIRIYNEEMNSKNMIQELNTTINDDSNIINKLQSKVTNLNEYINQLEQQITKYETTLAEYEEKLLNSSITNKVSIDNFGSFKSWTNYKVLNKNSTQWQIQLKAYTDKNGLRKIEDYYLCAIGTGWGIKLGERAKVHLSTGNSFNIIMCDVKDDKDTDSETHTYTTKNNCVVEFYVEKSALPKSVRISGSVSSISFFSGEVTNIEKIE